MKRLILFFLTILPLFSLAQAVPGCGTFTSSGAITATSNTTISGKSIDLGGTATVGINIPAGVHDVHITKCIIKNSTALSGLIRINSGCYNITIDTCFFESGWRGINGTTGNTSNIHIWYNYFHNIIDPNVTASSSDGGGSSVQLNGCNGPSIQILDNKSYHDVSGPGIGDQFSLYKCNGTPASPIRACRNQCLNGSNNPPGTGYVGMVGGDVGGSYQRCDSNTFVNCGSVCAQVQGGTFIEMSYNTGYLAQTSYTSVGIAFGNYSGQPSNNITMAFNNVRCNAANGNVFNYWFDPSTAFSPTGWASNTTSTALNASILPNPLWPACTPVVAPPSISYSPTSYSFTVGLPIVSIVSNSFGGAIVNYTVSPALPSGLSINSTTGIISGIPGAVTVSATYTVVAHNSGGTSSVPLTIVVKAPVIVPPNISYSPNTLTATVGTAITPLNPSNTGGAVTSWSISPALSAGLIFANGTILGIPLASSPLTTYTATATNGGGSSSVPITIKVNAIPVVAPNITYPLSMVAYIQNQGITALTPTNTGGIPTSYTSDVALPQGLSLNAATGVISGLPTAVYSPTAVTITATNTGGSSHYTITFAVSPAAQSHFVIIDGKFGIIVY
jgi:hypothetical protein